MSSTTLTFVVVAVFVVDGGGELWNVELWMVGDELSSMRKLHTVRECEEVVALDCFLIIVLFSSLLFLQDFHFTKDFFSSLLLSDLLLCKQLLTSKANINF